MFCALTVNLNAASHTVQFAQDGPSALMGVEPCTVGFRV